MRNKSLLKYTFCLLLVFVFLVPSIAQQKDYTISRIFDHTRFSDFVSTLESESNLAFYYNKQDVYMLAVKLKMLP